MWMEDPPVSVTYITYIIGNWHQFYQTYSLLRLKSIFLCDILCCRCAISSVFFDGLVIVFWWTPSQLWLLDVLCP
jgi:hypothetical protein